MKTNSSGAGAMFVKRAPEPELCHFYDGFAVDDEMDAGFAHLT